MAKPTYIVETKFLSGWENCWEEDGKAMTFDSKDAAELEIDELLKDVLDAVESGRMPFEYERSDYRVMRYDEAIDLVTHLSKEEEDGWLYRAEINATTGTAKIAVFDESLKKMGYL